MIKFYLNDAQKRIFQEPYQYSELFTTHDSILIRESINRARNLTVEAAQKEDAVSEFELPLNESHNESTKITYPAGQLEIGSVLARRAIFRAAQASWTPEVSVVPPFEPGTAWMASRAWTAGESTPREPEPVARGYREPQDSD